LKFCFYNYFILLLLYNLLFFIFIIIIIIYNLFFLVSNIYWNFVFIIILFYYYFIIYYFLFLLIFIIIIIYNFIKFINNLILYIYINEKNDKCMLRPHPWQIFSFMLCLVGLIWVDLLFKKMDLRGWRLFGWPRLGGWCEEIFARFDLLSFEEIRRDLKRWRAKLQNSHCKWSGNYEIPLTLKITKHSFKWV